MSFHLVSRNMRATRCIVALAVLLVPAGSDSQPVRSPDRIAAALREGRVEDAVSLSDEWIAAAPSDPRPRTLKGIALSGLGREDAAITMFESALDLAPSYLPALQGAAELQFRLGRPAARVRLERIVELQPDNVTAHAMLGVLSYAARDCKVALYHFSRGTRAVEADRESLRQRAECNFETGRFDQAAEDFRRLQSDRSAGLHLSHNLGLALHKAGRHEEAVQALFDAVAAAPAPAADTLSLLAEAQRAAGDLEGALDTLQQAIRNHPRSEELYLQLAEVCLEHGAYDLGLEIIEIGLQNVSDSHLVMTMRGILLAELGRYDEAESAFEAAIDANPDGQSAAVGLSLTLEKKGQIEDSLDVLRMRSERNPGDAVARFFYAQALIKRGIVPGSESFQVALEGLATAVEEMPREASPRIELGKLYLRAKQPERAISVLKEAMHLAPDNRQATYNLMIALRRVGRSAEAADLAIRIREQLERSKDEEIGRNRFRLVKNDQQPKQ